ncbi:pro-FMRFamide-related neuropeptide VF precursor [Danio rerio]|uniref:FMRFamide related peptide 1 n=1 Tax=Danio rerio TaxID=7955 RepID=Q1LW92_DANRE|nr:pro-FMRFamide-related neuropeptide VF precursor [Danio rerio]AAI63153.1 Neuropeptide VF precursor like [Danio rerio]AAI63155.1 Neuropeptide VF precursor like [Danio rerio]ABR68853.1 FMRFamide related peptide 1 [Danio rerio]ADB43132.1 neuropeptide GnIH [Danio rerio]BAF34890.1 RFamide-related peptide [Danio rerio]|eukprot:NP_001076418.1 pro-FMRFamide-related neuropeptide VF precursor [Danio rerio]
MSYFALLSLALGILSSFMLSEVTALRLPLSGERDLNGFTWGQFSENAQEIPRSLEIQDFTLNVAPTSGGASSPTILRLHPIIPKPAHLHANLPLRFGRDAQPGTGDRAPKSTINLPQRFGRSCTMCARSGTGPSATLPQRFGRRNIFALDPLRALALYTRTPESPSFPKERTQVHDYMFETVEDSEETVKNTDYTALD